MKSTTGDDCIRCPHCGAFNDNVTAGGQIPTGQTLVFKKNCINVACRKEIVFEVTGWAPIIRAYSEVPAHIKARYDEAAAKAKLIACEPAQVIPKF
jgi:hypothetical protein